MNLFQLQERLKNFSQDQLVTEMRSPTGAAPQYLILSELQRRRRIMQEEQAQMPQQQTTVAEDAVAASGVPQGGIAQMAQALAPQTDTGANTARMADGGQVRFPTFDDAGTDKFDEYLIIENIMRGNIPASEALPDGMSEELRDELARRRAMYTDRKAEGGEVRRMGVGGLSGISPRLTDFMPIGPSSRRASGRGIAITPGQMGQSIYEDYIDEMRRREAERRGSPEGLTGMTAEEVNRRANQGRYNPEDANPPTLGARDIAALAGADPIDLRGQVEFPTMGAGLSALMNPAPSRGVDDIIDNLSGVGVGSRFDATGDLRTFMSPGERARMILNDPEIADRAAALDLTPEQYISSLSPARQDAALSSAVQRAADYIPAMPEDRMMFGETPIGSIQSDRAPLPTPDLRDDERAARTADYNPRTLAADAQRMGLDLSGREPRVAPEMLPSIPEDINRARFADIPVGALPASDRMAFGETPVGDLRPERRVMSDNDLANLELLGYDMTDQSGDPGVSLADLLGFEDALQVRRDIVAEANATQDAEEEAADIAAARAAAPSFETEAEAADAEIAALPSLADQEDAAAGGAGGAGGGSGGGAGGAGGAGGGASSDDIYNQDKWLALAQAGLALMGSKAPTFGQALGEAGQSGIAALLKARGERQDRIEAAQTRADRLAAASRRSSTTSSSAINSAIDDARQELSLLLAEARSYRRVVPGDAALGTEASIVEMTPPGLQARIVAAEDRLAQLNALRFAGGDQSADFDATQ